MASRAPTPCGDRDTQFRQLSPAVFLYPPLSVPDNSSSPRLVILSSWVDARATQMAKYVAMYQKLYPTATILLVLSSMRYCLWQREGRRAVAPVPSAIRGALGYSPSLPAEVITSAKSEKNAATRQEQQPRLLIHIFSNGGSAMIYYIYKEFALTALRPRDNMGKGGLDPTLPAHVTIFDSAPSNFHYSRFINSILPSVPGGRLARWAAAPLVHLFCFGLLMRHSLLGVTDSSKMWGQAHNEKANMFERCRSYVYSEEDAAVDWCDVEAHAEEAEARGFDVVRREKFAGSFHVGHSRMDPERYWGLVKDTWESGSQGHFKEMARL